MKNKDAGVFIDKNLVINKVYKGFKRDLASLLSKAEIDEVIDYYISKSNRVDALGIVMYLRTIQYSAFCDKCGKCCKICNPIIITESEIPFYSQYFGDSFDKYIINKDGQWQLKKAEPCVFLMLDKKCRIYKYRPLVCRTYPFNNLDDIIINKGCKVIENILVEKIKMELFYKIMKKEQPELFEKIKKMQTKINKKFQEKLKDKKLPDQLLTANEIIDSTMKDLKEM